jgi:hypothetical protein
MLRLLGWKVDLIGFPIMYIMHHETAQVGTDLYVKLEYLSRELSLVHVNVCCLRVNLA